MASQELVGGPVGLTPTVQTAVMSCAAGADITSDRC